MYETVYTRTDDSLFDSDITKINSTVYDFHDEFKKGAYERAMYLAMEVDQRMADNGLDTLNLGDIDVATIDSILDD